MNLKRKRKNYLISKNTATGNGGFFVLEALSYPQDLTSKKYEFSALCLQIVCKLRK